MNATLLDTSVIVALLDRSERYHQQCVESLSGLSGSLVTSEACVTEACYLLREAQAAPDAVIANVARGIFQIPLHLIDQAAAVRKLLKKYRDVPMDLADACLVDLADRLGRGQILTLDRDFNIYRWHARRKFDALITL